VTHPADTAIVTLSEDQPLPTTTAKKRTVLIAVITSIIAVVAALFATRHKTSNLPPVYDKSLKIDKSLEINPVAGDNSWTNPQQITKLKPVIDHYI